MPRSCQLPLRLLWPQQDLCNSCSTEVPGQAEPVATGSARRGQRGRRFVLGFGCIPVRRSRGRAGLLGSSPALPGGLGPGDAQGLWGWGCAWGQPARGPGAAHTPWFGAGGDGGGLGGCHSVRFAPKAFPAALPAASRASLGEVRVVVQSFLFYILLCHAAPAAERARNSCQSREVSLQGLYSWLAGVTQS